MSKFSRTLLRSLRSLKATEYSKRTGKRDWGYVWFELWCSFLDTFYYSWMTPIVVFKESCQRVWNWLPILWEDRHWDYNFILKTLQHKIRFTRENIDKYGHEVEYSKRKKLKQMRICELLLARMIEDDYCRVELDELNQRWGTLKFGRRDIYRPKVFSAKDRELESKQFLAVYNKQEQMYQQDLAMFWKIFSKGHRGWWD